jgi:16S rRNA (adenine1518-N6/adenine1519-N6)-dimethyltransferase
MVFAVVDAAFAQRRKMLRSALATWAGGPDAAARILAEAGVPATARAEELDVAAFAAIAAAGRAVGGDS